MFGKRKAKDWFDGTSSSKRLRTEHDAASSLSRRVVIEELDTRNKRRKTPVGRRYTPGALKPGPRVAVRHEIIDPHTVLNIGGIANFTSNANTLPPDDFTNIVFEEMFPPQRNRQVHVISSARKHYKLTTLNRHVRRC